MEKSRKLVIFVSVALVVVILSARCNRSSQATVAAKPASQHMSAKTASTKYVPSTQATLTRLGKVEIVSVVCPSGKAVKADNPVETQKENVSVGSDDVNIISSLPDSTYRVYLKGLAGKMGKVDFVWTADDDKTQMHWPKVRVGFDKKGNGWVEITLNLDVADKKSGKPFRLVASGQEVQK